MAATKPTPDVPHHVAISTTGNGHKVRPDSQTKVALGAAFTLGMSLAGFLAVQVWLLNGRMATTEARAEAQGLAAETNAKAMRESVKAAMESQEKWLRQVLESQEKSIERLERSLDAVVQKLDAMANRVK